MKEVWSKDMRDPPLHKAMADKGVIMRQGPNGRLKMPGGIKIFLGIIILILCHGFIVMTMNACAGQRVALDIEDAVFYKQRLEALYSEYQDIIGSMLSEHRAATTVEHLRIIEIKVEFVALYEEMIRHLSIEDPTLEVYLGLLARLPL